MKISKWLQIGLQILIKHTIDEAGVIISVIRTDDRSKDQPRNKIT